MRKRITSAIVMALICIPFLLLGGLPSRIGVGLLSIFAYKEIIDLKGMQKYPKIVVILGLLLELLLVFSSRDFVADGVGLDYKLIILTFLTLFLPTVFYSSKKTRKYTPNDAFKLASFILFIGLTLNLISNILIYEKEYFFLIILVTIFTDTFAYFTGSIIGKHKGVTSISPNKSIEGFIGGIVMGTLLSSVYYMTFIAKSPLYCVIPVLIILCLSCELGDLFFSAIKREHEIKDFSKLIPGHGGILDRIDSLTFVTMTFVLLKNWI